MVQASLWHAVMCTHGCYWCSGLKGKLNLRQSWVEQLYQRKNCQGVVPSTSSILQGHARQT
eukprot:2497451-Ditylum_brightwellii.AAC.1